MLKRLVLVAFAFQSCAAVRLRQPNELAMASDPEIEACRENRETSYLVTGALAIGLGFLAGASGVSTLGFKTNADGSASGGQVGFGVASVGIGTASAVSTFLAGFFANKYNACGK